MFIPWDTWITIKDTPDFCLPEFVSLLHVIAGDGIKPHHVVCRMGRCWTLFIFIDWFLVWEYGIQ